MAPSSPLGEGRAKSRDHRLPLLEIPFPLFLSLCLSLSAIPLLPCSPVPSLARQRRSPFNSVLPSSSSSQNDSTSSVLNRSCARERLLSRTYLLPVFRNPGTPLPGIPARFVKSRCDLRGCDCMPRRLVSGESGSFFFDTPSYSRARLAALNAR